MTQTTPTASPVTVVLVHGAFADALSWTGVIERLQAGGVQVTAPRIPSVASPSTPPSSLACSIRSPARSSPSATRMAER